ncbi:MAG TPA: response regulator [Acidobacteriota bacterium]|nr:response regulator [Acidobacteriota bacterium]
MKVLTVDDSRTIRLLIKRYLQPLDLEVIEAADGQQGVEKARQEKPDLIILDVTMPVMDGQECLKQIRSHSQTDEIPVLMLTAESRKEMVVSLIKMGISDYIVKPFNQELLLKKVSTVLGLSDDVGAEEPQAGEEDGRPRVLVLDDKVNVLKAARRYLQDHARVITSAEPYEAVELANKHVPQVLFLDLVIPGQNVFEIFSMMRADEVLENSRFVAMAIRTMRDEMGRARRAGFHDMLIKPFDERTIVACVKANMAGSQELLSYEGDYAAFHFPPLSEHSVSAAAFAQQALRKAEQAMHEIADSGYERLLLDMSEATQTDMSVVSCVSSIQKSAGDLGIHLSIMVPDPSLARMLRQFSETSHTPIFSTMEEALEAFPVNQ